MAEVIIPEICANAASFGLIRADTATELLSGTEVYTVFAKAVWALDFQHVLMKEGEDTRKWRSALTKLSSFGNYFRSGPLGYTGAVYSATTLLVDGIGQIGADLDIKAATPSATVLLEGEYFQIGNELKIVTEDCVADGLGNANVKFDPPLRESPSDNDPLNIATPTAKFRLSEPRSNWGSRPGQFTVIQVQAIESFAT